MSTEEIKKFLSEIGKKGGDKNKTKGPEYFRWVASHRKTKGRQKKTVESSI